MKNKTRKINTTAGITLVALVVTIIVLIILAVISINIVFGEDGIISRARQGQKEHNISSAKEKLTLRIADLAMDITINEKRDLKLEDILRIDSKEYEVKKNDDGSIYITEYEEKKCVIVYCDGYGFYVLGDQTIIYTEEKIEQGDSEDEVDEQEEYSYMTTGLKLYLDGENNTGNGHDTSVTSWKDLSGNGNDGTLNGGTWTDNGLSLDGTDDWVNLGYHDYGNYTLEAIFEINELLSTDQQCILGNWHTGGGGIAIETDNKIFADFYINGEYDVLYADTTSTNTKYKVTITSTGKEQKMYVNGELVSSSTPNGVIEIPNKNTVMAIRRKSIKRCYSESISFRNSIFSKNI